MRLATDAGDVFLNWIEIRAGSPDEAATEFAQHDCDADGDNYQRWLLGGQDVVVEDTETSAAMRFKVEGEASVEFWADPIAKEGQS